MQARKHACMHNNKNNKVSTLHEALLQMEMLIITR